MTSIAEAWSGAAFSQALFNDTEPHPSLASSSTPAAAMNEKDIKATAMRYIERAYALQGPEGIASLLPRQAVVDMRNYALFNLQYWTDTDLAIMLLVFAMIVYLID